MKQEVVVDKLLLIAKKIQEIYVFIKPLFIHLHCAVIQKDFGYVLFIHKLLSSSKQKIEVVLNQHALIGKTTYLLILELADQLSQMDQVSRFLYCITVSC